MKEKPKLKDDNKWILVWPCLYKKGCQCICTSPENDEVPSKEKCLRVI